MPNQSGSGRPLLLHGHPQAHVMWHRVGSMSAWYDVPRIWRDWADDVRGRAIDSGHYLTKQAPDETAGELRAFVAE